MSTAGTTRWACRAPRANQPVRPSPQPAGRVFTRMSVERVIYLDSPAIVKPVVREPESAASVVRGSLPSEWRLACASARMHSERWKWLGSHISKMGRAVVDLVDEPTRSGRQAVRADSLRVNGRTCRCRGDLCDPDEPTSVAQHYVDVRDRRSGSDRAQRHRRRVGSFAS